MGSLTTAHDGSPFKTGWIQTASAGFACYPAAGTDTDSLLHAADRALYAAKTNGRDRTETAVGTIRPAPALIPASA